MRDKAFKIASDPKCDGYQRGLARQFTSFLMKNPLRLINLVEVVSLMNQIINCQVSFINQLFENLKKEKLIHHLETISGVLI